MQVGQKSVWTVNVKGARTWMHTRSINSSTFTPRLSWYTVYCTRLQTPHMHFSHIHTPSAQQVWHFAPNVIFQPISSIIALLISVSDWSGNRDGCWAFFPLGIHLFISAYTLYNSSILSVFSPWDSLLSLARFQFSWSLVSLVSGSGK